MKLKSVHCSGHSQNQKFALKYINALFCGSYLFTMFTTLLLIVYVYHVDSYYRRTLMFEKISINKLGEVEKRTFESDPLKR